MKFTKTLIVIAIVLGLLTIGLVGCFAEEVCYTTISQGGEQFINPNSFINVDALITASASNIIGDNELTTTLRLWKIESINTFHDPNYLIYAMTCEYSAENIGNEIIYKFFGADNTGGEIQTPPSLTYDEMLAVFNDDTRLIMTTSVITANNSRLILNGQNPEDYSSLFGISYIEDETALGVEYVVTSQINYCFNTTKGENEDMTVVEQVLAVFSAIGEWFAEIIPSMLAVFYDADTNTLTVIGVLAVCSLAIAVILLVLAWIVDFFKFRR